MYCLGLITGLAMALSYAGPTAWADEGRSIRPYGNNPWYWEYRGEPVLLIGASDKDNLWQWTGMQLTEHLDLMQSVGGNYVRNMMSDRNEGDLFAAKPLDDGRYDLDQWNDAYWERLRFFLEETHTRQIIAQLTLWDWFDLSGGCGSRTLPLTCAASRRIVQPKSSPVSRRPGTAALQPPQVPT